MTIPETLYVEVLHWHDGHKAYRFADSYASQCFEWMLIERDNEVFRARAFACLMAGEITVTNVMAQQALNNLFLADGRVDDAH